MIPKIIHLCWMSGDDYPPKIQECLNSWKEHLPDYEVWLWDTHRFDVNSTQWTKEAFEKKKYAFVADYIRLYALYFYGGIYLDSDVMVYKNFDDLLDLPYFIGQDYCGAFEAAVIGAEKEISWIGDLLNRYHNRVFISQQGDFDMLPLPQIFFNELYGKYVFKQINRKVQYDWDKYHFYLFDKDFFNSRNSIGSIVTSKSYCSHNYSGTWKDNDNSLKSCLKKIMPVWLLKIFYDISHSTYKKRKIHQYDPIYLQDKENLRLIK